MPPFIAHLCCILSYFLTYNTGQCRSPTSKLTHTLNFGLFIHDPICWIIGTILSPATLRTGLLIMELPLGRSKKTIHVVIYSLSTTIAMV